MRILVIGGTRFIGPHLVHRLALAGHEVAVFHRGQMNAAFPPDVRTLLGDRRRLVDHADELRRFSPDVVVDMISYTEEDAHSLMEVFRGVAGRLVMISSGDVYRAYGIFARLEPGMVEPTPIKENSPLRQGLYITRATGAKPGDDLYDYEKILVERVVMENTRLPATLLRLPMVYGPGDTQHRFAPYLKRMLDGRLAILINEGVARWRCPRGYVEDVAVAIDLAVTAPRAAGKIYNVADSTAYSEAEWVARIGSIVGWKGEIVMMSEDKLPVAFNTAQDLNMDTNCIRTDLGYREVVDRNEGIRKTVEWEKGHLSELQLDYKQEDILLTEL
jgi:nucleoside-diphosphate-sugar epimerase